MLNVGTHAGILHIAIKRQWARLGLLLAVANIKKMIFVISSSLHEGRHSPAIIWLCLWFFSIFFGEISQKFHNLWKLSCWSIKSRKKIGVTNAVSLLFTILCFLRQSWIWSYEFFFYWWQALGRKQICLTAQQILENFTEGKEINLAWKIPIFVVTKHYLME